MSLVKVQCSENSFASITHHRIFGPVNRSITSKVDALWEKYLLFFFFIRTMLFLHYLIVSRFVSRKSSLSGWHVYYTKWVSWTPGWLWSVLSSQPGWPRWTGRLFSQLFVGVCRWVSRTLLQDGVTSRAGAFSCGPGSLCASFGPQKTPRTRAPSKKEDCGRCKDHVPETDWTEGLLSSYVLGWQTKVGFSRDLLQVTQRSRIAYMSREKGII